MKDYYNKTLYIVIRIAGESWDIDKPVRMQNGWDEHAAYMDQLAEEGFIVLGGPLEESGSSLFIVDATNENEILEKLMLDNWSRMNILKIKEIKPWTIWLQAGD